MNLQNKVTEVVEGKSQTLNRMYEMYEKWKIKKEKVGK